MNYYDALFLFLVVHVVCAIINIDFITKFSKQRLESINRLGYISESFKQQRLSELKTHTERGIVYSFVPVINIGSVIFIIIMKIRN